MIHIFKSYELAIEIFKSYELAIEIFKSDEMVIEILKNYELDDFVLCFEDLIKLFLYKGLLTHTVVHKAKILKEYIYYFPF